MILYSLAISHPEKSLINVFITATLLYALWYALIPDEYRLLVVIATVLLDLYFYHFQLPKSKDENTKKSRKSRKVTFDPQNSYYYYPSGQDMNAMNGPMNGPMNAMNGMDMTGGYMPTGHMGSYNPGMMQGSYGMPPPMMPAPASGGVDNRHLLNEIQSSSSDDQISVSSSSESSYSTRSDT